MQLTIIVTIVIDCNEYSGVMDGCILYYDN